MVIRQHLANIARIREPLTFRHAQKEPRKPVGEIAADEQQMIVFEFVKKLLRRQMFALQRTDEFEKILIRDHVGRRGRHAAEQVIDDRALQAIALRWQVRHAVRRVGEHLGRRRAAEALQVNGAFEERIKRG